MKFPAGHKKSGGRQKGTPNKDTQNLLEKSLELGVDPFEVLLLYVKRDWKALNFPSGTETRVLKDGGTIVIPIITPEMQMNAAREVCQYIYPKRKAIELSTEEDKGFVIRIEDYGKKDK